MTNIVEGLEEKPNAKYPVARYSKLLLITENKQGQGNFPLHANVNFPSSKYESETRINRNRKSKLFSWLFQKQLQKYFILLSSASSVTP